MSYNALQLSPQASTHMVREKSAISDPPTLDLVPCPRYADDYDDDVASSWGAFSGLVILVTVSASFWTVVGLMIARALK